MSLDMGGGVFLRFFFVTSSVKGFIDSTATLASFNILKNADFWEMQTVYVFVDYLFFVLLIWGLGLT